MPWPEQTYSTSACRGPIWRESMTGRLKPTLTRTFDPPALSSSTSYSPFVIWSRSSRLGWLCSLRPKEYVRVRIPSPSPSSRCSAEDVVTSNPARSRFFPITAAFYTPVHEVALERGRVTSILCLIQPSSRETPTSRERRPTSENDVINLGVHKSKLPLPEPTFSAARAVGTSSLIMVDIAMSRLRSLNGATMVLGYRGGEIRVERRAIDENRLSSRTKVLLIASYAFRSASVQTGKQLLIAHLHLPSFLAPDTVSLNTEYEKSAPIRNLFVELKHTH
ncbi:hypothetical protein BU16DRAFT_540168 [Lophium mytilinum]|uniref:Uncharacterized protein n=1 Tax=Lophium mytilinum TaxID=390894 RepID=A0A6A6QSF7_9PEZI|nr:hypothetical protein BU16DRAFT_540168 [Lophium mytilinum]